MRKFEDINSEIVVKIYEGVCATQLVDKITPIQSSEDEIHNIQAVIDSLSLDILHEDLSHINGEDVFNRELLAIENLFEIFTSIHEWVQSTLDAEDITSNNEEEEEDENTSSGRGTSPISIESDFNQLKEKLQEESSIKSKESSSSNDKQIKNGLKNFIDESIDLSEDIRPYLGLEKKLEQTIKITQNAINPRLRQSNESWLNLIDDDDDDGQNTTRRTNLSYGNLNEFKSKRDEILDQLTSDNSTSSSEESVKIEKSGKKVKFRSFLSDNSESTVISVDRPQNLTLDQTNELSIIKDGVKKSAKNDEKIIRNLLRTVYEDDLHDAESLLRLSADKVKRSSDLTNDVYMKTHQPLRMGNLSARPSKGVLISDDYKKPLKKVEKRAKSTSPLRTSGSTLIRGTSKSRFVIGDNGILGALLEEFPYLYLSPETIHSLWEKHSKQIESLKRQEREIKVRQSKNKSTTVQAHLDETYRKQKMLMDIMRKEIVHIQRVQDLKRKQEAENSLKARAREQRFQNVKCKKYFEEFRLQQRAKMLKKSTQEEVLFKKLFNESLKIQKERIREMKKYANEQRDVSNKQQLNQIESIENYYKNKFDLLNEQIRKEKDDMQVREKAQHEILCKMKNHIRKKLETDIRDLQEQLANDTDHIHWRQMDAQRLESELKFARYQAKV